MEQMRNANIHVPASFRSLNKMTADSVPASFIRKKKDGNGVTKSAFLMLFYDQTAFLYIFLAQRTLN